MYVMSSMTSQTPGIDGAAGFRASVAVACESEILPPLTMLVWVQFLHHIFYNNVLDFQENRVS